MDRPAQLSLIIVFWPGSSSRSNLQQRLDLAECQQARAIAESQSGLILCPDWAAEYFAGVPCLTVSGLTGWFRVWRKLGAFAPRVVLALGRDSLRAAARVARFCKSPHLVGAFFLQPPQLGRSSLKLIRSMGRIFCGTSDMALKIAALLPLAPLVVCIPGTCQRERTPINGERFVFAMDQALQPNSGAMQVVRAMAALWQAPDLPPWEVRMFGSGPCFKEVLSEAEKLGVASRLAILDDQCDSTMFSGCSAWLAPGRPEPELPLTLWGGVAAGIPMIAADTPLHRDWMAAAGADHLSLVGTDNPQELACQMIVLLREPALRKNLEREAAKIRERISLQSVAVRIKENLARL